MSEIIRFSVLETRRERLRRANREYSHRKFGFSPRKTEDEAFWAKVDKSGDCWLWRGGLNGAGYGRWRDNKRAHRVAWEKVIGSIPNGQTLDHLCRNRRCVNPSHLEPVSSIENVMRGVGFAPRNKAKTECSRGHLYTEETTRWRNGGRWRECRVCAKQKS